MSASPAFFAVMQGQDTGCNAVSEPDGTHGARPLINAMFFSVQNSACLHFH